MMPRIRKRMLIAFIVFVTVLLSTVAYWRWFHEDRIKSGEFKREKYHLSSGNTFTASDVPELSKMNEELSSIAQRVSSSIVSIRTAGVTDYKKFTPMEGVVTQRVAVQGLGSGVIISREGHIITNQHVINNKQAFRVTLSNDKTYPVYLVGEDKLLDIAVLKIDSEDRFDALPFGNSDEVKVGQIVMAFGNPYGLSASMTQGIVSGRDRRMKASPANWIQTDAAIHPGNSGGPLVNIYGEIIGINTAVSSQDENISGLGFAISSNMVLEAFHQICEYGHPMRGYHGVEFIDNTPDLNVYLNYHQLGGVIVNTIIPGSPGQKAGLKRGDLVTKINGEKVKSVLDIVQKLEKLSVGDLIELTVMSLGKERQESMKLGDIQNDNTISYPSLELLQNKGIKLREFSLVELSHGARGVQVTQVDPHNEGASIFRPNDIIYAVDNEPLGGLEDLDAKLMRGKAVLSVSRQSERFNVNVNLKR
ncbi:MAG: trypsin-like peptidase domain-containing protein [Akkermansia sp.]